MEVWEIEGCRGPLWLRRIEGGLPASGAITPSYSRCGDVERTETQWRGRGAAAAWPHCLHGYSGILNEKQLVWSDAQLAALPLPSLILIILTPGDS